MPRVVQRVLCSLMLVVSCACFTACQAIPTGVHRRAKLIGGGGMVEFTAPQDGVCYLVDASDRTLLATQTLKAGERFDYELTEGNWEQLMGIKYGGNVPAHAFDTPPRLLVYFVSSAALGLKPARR